LQLITLTNSNIATFQEGLEIGELWKTFRDAIYVAQRLTVQYIWIDSLCIVQDSEDDWKRESSLTMSVYTEAFCNIAATAAVNARTGLFFDRDVSIPRDGDLEVPKQSIRPLYGTALTKPFGFIKSIPRTIVKVMTKKGRVNYKASRISDSYNAPSFEPGKYSVEQTLFA
jgi:hypothetical protein